MKKKYLHPFLTGFFCIPVMTMSAKCVSPQVKKNIEKYNKTTTIEFLDSGLEIDNLYKSQLNISQFSITNETIDSRYEYKPLYITFDKNIENNIAIINYQIYDKNNDYYSKVFTHELKTKKIENLTSENIKNIKETIKKMIAIYKPFEDEIINFYENKYQNTGPDEGKFRYVRALNIYKNFINSLTSLSNKIEFWDKQWKLDFHNNKGKILKNLQNILKNENKYFDKNNPDFVTNINENDKNWEEFFNSKIYIMLNTISYWSYDQENSNYQKAKERYNKIIDQSYKKCVVVVAHKKWCPFCKEIINSIQPRYLKKYKNDVFEFISLDENLEDKKLEENFSLLNIIDDNGGSGYKGFVPYVAFIYKGIVINSTTFGSKNFEDFEALRKIYEN